MKKIQKIQNKKFKNKKNSEKKMKEFLKIFEKVKKFHCFLRVSYLSAAWGKNRMSWPLMSIFPVPSFKVTQAWHDFREAETRKKRSEVRTRLFQKEEKKQIRERNSYHMPRCMSGRPRPLWPKIHKKFENRKKNPLKSEWCCEFWKDLDKFWLYLRRFNFNALFREYLPVLFQKLFHTVCVRMK